MRFFCSRNFWTAVIVGTLLGIVHAAKAEQVAVATDNGDTVELHDRLHGKCPPGIGEAVYNYDAKKNVKPVIGCWKFVSERNAIYLVFEDGDTLLIPVEVFNWRRGRKPVAL